MSEKKSRSAIVEELLEIAGLTPPICHLDIPHEVDVLGKKVAVYCKPFEEFQGVMREAAAAIAEAEPVRHGRWIEKDDGVMHCTECDRVGNPHTYNYCPHCGAKMDGVK